jgi:hypothetical protein
MGDLLINKNHNLLTLVKYIKICVCLNFVS